MKNKRHSKILELISSHVIDTQEELLKRLNDSGFTVTQATVSRDIKELRLIKIQNASGEYRYATGTTVGQTDMSNKFHMIFSESVQSIDSAMNIVVIKCFTGMANAVCASLDSMHWEGMVGTLAGDDTIFCVMRNEINAHEYTAKLTKLIAK